MNIVAKITAGASAALLLTAAEAGVTLNSARVGGPDVVALGKFYEAAFGLKEVNKLSLPGGQVELFLNVGDTVDAAKANSQAQIVIMHADATGAKDPVPHLIFNVTDMAATVAAVKAAGGTMDEPRPFGNSGMMIGFATDPAGNRIELIQPAKQ